MPDQWVLLLLVGFGAGILSGLFGIGGGIVIVPALTIFLGFTTVQATSTSLAALLMPVGIFAVIAYYRARKIDVRASAIIGVGLAATSLLGARLALALNATDPTALRVMYGIFALAMSWRFAEPRKWLAELRGDPIPTLAHNPGAKNPAQEASADAPILSVLLIGLVAGVLAGMFGIGGGIVIVPALAGLLHYEQKRAVGTSLGALLLPVGLPGVLEYYGAGVLNIPVAVVVAVGLVFGSLLGANVALRLPSKLVKRLYGIFLFFVALRFIFGG